MLPAIRLRWLDYLDLLATVLYLKHIDLRRTTYLIYLARICLRNGVALTIGGSLASSLSHYPPYPAKGKLSSSASPTQRPRGRGELATRHGNKASTRYGKWYYGIRNNQPLNSRVLLPKSDFHHHFNNSSTPPLDSRSSAFAALAARPPPPPPPPP
ncbi:hypothetical protein CGCTS75_v014414, partial [Colletotrichum tropicale]